MAQSRSFVVRKTGELNDDFSYVRCLSNVPDAHDNVNEKICRLILQVRKIRLYENGIRILF